ncbi:unnamed protein product [Larinioides sclopetarius]|uniref:Uncharacterized protein n=1 Tax=Larinioides sclopetarius TaxID=280406 RepID=A0AAV2A9E5_9ARAC
MVRFALLKILWSQPFDVSTQRQERAVAEQCLTISFKEPPHPEEGRDTRAGAERRASDSIPHLCAFEPAHFRMTPADRFDLPLLCCFFEAFLCSSDSSRTRERTLFITMFLALNHPVGQPRGPYQP